tara:strand:- start:1729 stop:1923 length:195 start_codon:yes stop_codon:yes gene_type:complete
MKYYHHPSHRSTPMTITCRTSTGKIETVTNVNPCHITTDHNGDRWWGDWQVLGSVGVAAPTEMP